MKGKIGLAFGLMTVLGLSLSTLRCGSETAGESAIYEVAVQGVSDDSKAISTETGWEVELDSAAIALGPIYLYENPAYGEGEGGGFASLFISEAYACPTHAQYDKGVVLGEVLTQHSVNLLAEVPEEFGAVDGVKGEVQSMELHVHPPGTIGQIVGDSDLGGSSLYIVGTARKGDEVRPFIAALDIPDEGTMRIVENITAAVELSEGGKIVIEVSLDDWFQNVDFASLSEQDGEGNYLFTEDTQAFNALLQGVRSRFSYSARWEQ